MSDLIARLRTMSATGWHPIGDEAADEIDRLTRERNEARAERDAMAKDAKRYRWLRGDACPDHSVRWAQWEVRCWRAPFWTSDLRREKLDAAIDAQIEQEKANGSR